MRPEGMVHGWEDGWPWILSFLRQATVWFTFETLAGLLLVI